VVILPVLVAALVACGNGGQSPPVVDASNFRFAPATVHVHAGDTVVWHNGDATEHTIKGPGFFSRAVEPGRRWSHRFTRPGSYAYSCTLHRGMSGRVEVASKP
jgi:plastocyanin